MKKSTTTKRLNKSMTKKEKIIFLVTEKGLNTYEAIAKVLKCNTKEVRDYVWCI
jgi:DNA-binding CsgD family transcriptional regulator